jgi:hypothetical protein
MEGLIEGTFGNFYHIGPVYTTLYPAAGNSIDWTYVNHGILSMAFECRDTGNFGFELPADQIIPQNQELLPSILHMTDSEWVRLPLRFDFPQGLPAEFTAGQPTTIQVRVIEQTEVVQPGSPVVQFRYDSSATFQSLALTPLGGDLYEASLPPTSCWGSPEFYFSAQSTTGTAVTSPRNAAVGDTHTAAMSTGRVAFFFDDLPDSAGWTMDPGWAFGTPTGAGGEYGPNDPTSGHTGPYVYGYNLLGDYPNSLPPRRLTTTAFDCSGSSQTRLEFWRWLGVETPEWDHATIDASNDGVNWVTVWQNTDEVADSQWTQQTVDLSAVADGEPTVYVRWTMGPTDSAFRFCGWNIDDVALTSSVCEALPGDWEGNGTVDAVDFSHFEDCYSGEGGGIQPICGVFDVIGDGDVDCNDWAAFHAAWTGPGDPPTFVACAEREAPVAIGAGARYLSITPTPTAPSVAIRVTSPDYPCLEQYADFAPNPIHAAAGLGRLYDAPVYRTPAEWGTLRVSDAELVPGRLYGVQLVASTEPWSMEAPARTRLWGDAIEPIGTVSAVDIAAVVDAVRGAPGAAPVEQCDLEPETPNLALNVFDVAAVVDAVKNVPYPFGIPCD